MKKILLITAIAGFTFACNSDTSKSSTTATDSATTTAPAATDTTSATKPALKDGLMTMKDGKMMIVKDGSWVAMDAPVTCTNGRKVAVDGEVSKANMIRSEL